MLQISVRIHEHIAASANTMSSQDYMQKDSPMGFCINQGFSIMYM